MPKIMLLLTVILSPFAVSSQTLPTSPAETRPAPTWTMSLTGGYTNTFQMILGGTFGKGHDIQDRFSAGINNAFLKGDTLSAIGWNTTDFPSEIPSWQAGLMYKAPLLHRKNHTLYLTGSGQRWILPTVKTGAMDWIVIGNLTYGTSVKRLPVFFSGDSYSTLRSTLPLGSAVYWQIYTQQPLITHHGLRLSFREGPAYTYSWELYGANGNRVARYGGTLISTWKGTTVESGYRKQWGLQHGIVNNGYWSVLVTKQFSGTFHPE
jgi:hypothetical protein